MSIQPKKLKAHIGAIKIYLDEIQPSSIIPGKESDFLSKCYQVFLIAELCQRGVIHSFDVDDRNATKLMTVIQSTAGKIMLDDNMVPKPLVAGSSVISSMVAEKIADIMLESSLLGNDIKQQLNFLSSDECESALQRCKDVGDARFEMLLNLPKSFVDEASPEKVNSDSPVIAAILLLRISMGNLLRAASFSNPDQPPMWKRCTDLCVKLNVTITQYSDKQEERSHVTNDEIYSAYHTSDAIYPLTNLIRIAESKKNTKRVSELCLHLAESYISECDESSNLNQLLSEKVLSVWKEITNTFVIPYIPSKFQNMSDILSNITNGKKILNRFNEKSTESLRLKVLYQILCLRMDLEHENFIVKTLSKNRNATAKNRTGIVIMSSTSSSSSSNTASVYETVRRDLLSKSLSEEEANDIIHDGYEEDKIYSTAKLLQSTIMSISESDLKECIQEDMQNAIYDLFALVIDRLLKKAQALSLQYKSSKKGKGKCTSENVQGAWDSVDAFVKPFLDECKKNNIQAIDLLSKKDTIRTGALAVFSTVWMKQNNQASQDLIDTCTKILSDYLQEMNEIDEKRVEDLKNKGENLIQTSGNSSVNLSLKTLIKWMTLTGHCHSYLSELSSESKETVANCQRISAQVIKCLPELESTTSHVQFGMAYYMFLSCWSGFHKAPWSFFNVTKARAIICLTREKLSVCEREWGRGLSKLELLMIDLGEADAECGYLSGGFIDKAKILYTNVLSKVGSINVEKTLVSLICSHCAAGLLMISFLDLSHNAKITEDTIMYLSDLMSLRGSNTTTSFDKFTNVDSFQSSVDFHLCQLRTLIAESFIKSGEVSKAEKFLKDAVADSPSNYDASFALGSFWLRMSFDKNASNHREVSKKGQMQLLRSLKLNSTTADPFSLLGVWYEAQKDLKRALGCFSKALLIDPSHPVAGRGILRLRRRNDVLKICNEAVSVISNTNGWAWRTLGDVKALDNGEDEVAIACYQQALRSRDIENAEHHYLSSFFVSSCIYTDELNECSKTWASLASCYRRLGKFTASLRAYQFAAASGRNEEFICAWAQVELELGLLEDAALKFDQVLNDNSQNIGASYGAACCCLMLANRNIDDGKFGAALEMLRKGIKTLTSLKEEHHFICTSKLLGDLYSYGYKIPQAVFRINDSMGKKVDCNSPFDLKKDFLEKGYVAYERCQKKVESNTTKNGQNELMSSALSDLATNLLLQAHFQMNNKMELDEAIILLLTKARWHYSKAIDLNELDASLWCGLGCSLYHINQIISQHAFCRAIQLDKNCADAWTNLGFVYVEHHKIPECEAVIDALTQVADTPLMWILRGMLLEKKTSDGLKISEKLQNASDAYRACLQTSKNQSALLGLASTCRRVGSNVSCSTDDFKIIELNTSAKESLSSLSLFLSAADNQNDRIPLFLQKVTEIDSGKDDLNSSIFNNLIDKVDSFRQKFHTRSTQEESLTLDSTHRYVHMNPDDGEGWLKLTKQMILEFTKIQSPSHHHHALLIDTIQRTKRILKENVFNSYENSSEVQSNVVRSINAGLLADAEVLSSWVQRQVDDKESSQSLQRALILDPENRFARIKIQ